MGADRSEDLEPLVALRRPDREVTETALCLLEPCLAVPHVHAFPLQPPNEAMRGPPPRVWSVLCPR